MARKKAPKNPVPKWILDENYGISADRYTWILWYAARNKKGEIIGWGRRHSYYPSLVQLFSHLAVHIARTEDPQEEVQTLLEWVESAYDRAKALSDNFKAQLIAEGFEEIQRPSAPSEDYLDD